MEGEMDLDLLYTNEPIRPHSLLIAEVLPKLLVVRLEPLAIAGNAFFSSCNNRPFGSIQLFLSRLNLILFSHLQGLSDMPSRHTP